MAQVLKTIALVCLVLSALGIAVSVYLWFRLNIYKVWCDLTGRTEQKALEEIKKANAEAKKPQPADYSDRASNEDLEQIWSESRVLSKTDDIRYFTEESTDQMRSSELERDAAEEYETEMLTATTGTGAETGVLDQSFYPQTEITAENETEILSYIDPESEVLSDSITEKLPDLSEYLGSGQTMEIDSGAAGNEEPEPDLSSQTFRIIGKTTQVETDNRII
ncbi:hypothetical protein ACH52_0229 [Eubacterium limosum]|nr:hypothetical protein ACH52_0229 [Eubacterium limosum]